MLDTGALIENIVQESLAGESADVVLRRELKKSGGLSRSDASFTARTVFGYFRWRGWLEESKPLAEQIAESRVLARRFEKDPHAFAESEMLARAVPSWISQEFPVEAPWVVSLQEKPKLWLRTKRGEAKEVSKDLSHCRPPRSGLPEDALEYQGVEDLFGTRIFSSGQFEVQDLSSQAIGWLCGPKPGETWWDACAGAGGKTLHLSQLMENKGLIWATDAVEWRLKELRRRAARARAFNFRARQWNGSPKLPVKTKFDGVLVDAPCSGIGTWQRNPHARWTLTSGDVDELVEKQKQILAHASEAVKPGGKLVYSVCTLTRRETHGVADWFENAFAHFGPLKQPNPLKDEMASSARHLFMAPEIPANGMFAAVWKRL
jgi:16S rRNA (cytosine967-C5)-methyltransferase